MRIGRSRVLAGAGIRGDALVARTAARGARGATSRRTAPPRHPPAREGETRAQRPVAPVVEAEAAVGLARGEGEEVAVGGAGEAAASLAGADSGVGGEHRDARVPGVGEVGAEVRAAGEGGVAGLRGAQPPSPARRRRGAAASGSQARPPASSKPAT